jgi:hypothetical protein
MSERDPRLEPFGDDSFEGLFQLAETPGEWQDDMKVTYRRRLDG